MADGERIKKCLEELKFLFNADAVGVKIPQSTINNKVDYEIRIYNADKISFNEFQSWVDKGVSE